MAEEKLFEREVSSAQALDVFNAECKSSQLTPHFDAVGTHIKTYRCQLFDSSGAYLSQGFGKGIGIQSKVSAAFESLEHLWSSENPEKVETFFHRASEKGVICVLPPGLENFFQDEVLPWVKISPLFGSGNFRTPRFCIDPHYVKRPLPDDHFDYSRLNFSVNGNGLAIGTSVDEAILHAICERVERDSVSRVIATSFLRKKPLPLQVVNAATLPGPLSELLEYAQNEINREIMVIDATSENDIPTYFAAIKNRETISRGGAGASLSPECAFKRAVLETIQETQGLDLDGATSREESLAKIKKINDTTQERFARWPALLHAATADFFDIKDVTLTQLRPEVPLPSEVNALIAIAEKKLRAQGLSCFQVIHKRSAHTGIVLVSVLIPGLEDFTFVEYGEFFVPRARALQWING